MNSSEIKCLHFPGDKSIAHRLVLLSLLVNKKILINNLPDSKDVRSSLDIVKTLGVEVGIREYEKNIELKPLNKKDFGKEEIVLDCGDSGTTARLLCGILANLKGKFKLIGDESLSKRPMERVVRPLADLMGLKISSTDGHLPIYIEANGKTKAADFFNQTGSAQVKSAVLFAGMAAEGKTIVSEKILSRDHTERLLYYLQLFQHNKMSNKIYGGGQPACSTLFSSAIPQVNRHCEPKVWQSNISDDRLNFSIPGDISSAAYFIILYLITRKSLKIENVLLNPTRTGFISVLRRMGADIEVQIKEDIWEPVGDIIVKGGNLKATEILADEIPSLIDELPILAVAMTFAKGKSRVSGAKELRVKESDRISCLISQLKKAGVDCCEFDDGYEISGKSEIVSTELDSFNDHRLAMSFAILSKCSKADIKVKDRDSVSISFPEFYNYLGNNN